MPIAGFSCGLVACSVIICDHRGRGAVRLTPLPRAAAFDPSGRTRARLLDAELVLVDGVEKKVLRRIPLAD